MSSDDPSNTKVQSEASEASLQDIADALRRMGLAPTTAKRLVFEDRKYWLISNGAFSTVVDERDASSAEEALAIARMDQLQPWYINATLADAITVKHASRGEYIEWLRRGVR